MKKFVALLIAVIMICSLAITSAMAENLKVGIVNNPPSESGYREANVKDFEKVFSADNGYDAESHSIRQFSG